MDKRAVLLVAFCGALLATPLSAQCVGDCDGDGSVTVDEVLTGVRLALSGERPDACAPLDVDENQRIDVHELVAAVASLLDDCGRRTPTPTRTPGVGCGDGLVADAEECDDGNHDSGDGCSDACLLEPGGDACAGVPSTAGTSLRTVLVAEGLSRPLYVTAPRLDPRRLFVVEQTGRVRIVKDGVLVPGPLLDLTESVSCCGERGLLGLAFHPDFERNGRFFVDYTDRTGSTVIARYQVSSDPDVADADSGQTLLTIRQPYPNHNGGQLAIGPDGYLYVGMGDGGSAGDPQENGQSDTSLLGKLLRLDVDVEEPPFYAVPASNPHPTAVGPLGLVWATGLRNPWRFSFDRSTGDLYIADVGQGTIEEVDVQAAASAGGENYGWDVFEGSDCYDPEPLFDSCPTPADGFVMPVLQYTHAEGCSVTGGYVYRGCALPDLRGTYFYGDYCRGFVRSFVYAAGSTTQARDWTVELAPGGGRRLGDISSFGEDARGELYLCNLSDGLVFKIAPRD